MQRDADFGVELGPAPGVVFQEEIELRTISQDAEDDLGGQRGVARIEPGGMRQQKVGRPGAGFHAEQDVEGENAGGSGHECSV